MENYDDVRQFITKVGDQNLNYRSFQTNTPSSGQSKWRLINQVENYTQPFSNPVTERNVPLHVATGHSGFENTTVLQSLSQPIASLQPTAYPEVQSPAAFHSGRHTAFQSPKPVAAFNPFRRQQPESDIGQLHKKSQQQSQAEVQSTNTDSLAALFYRIAL